MAERVEEPEAEGASEAGVGPINPAAAMAIGMRKGRGGAKGDAKLDAFLDRQTLLTELQTEHLHEQRELVLSRLRWGRFSDRIKAALQLMTAAVGLTIAGAVAVMAWQAHEDHGVAIEAFSAPPDFAARGLTGQVIASQLLDKIADLQQKTVTQRPASTYANDWGGDIKVEIPETGVSIGELNRGLRRWLGSETRISGEIVRTAGGVAVTARAGEAPGRRFEGPEADIDSLIGGAAVAIYAQTQPYRYAVYLQSSGRDAEARGEYIRIAQSGSALDRPWALVGWASLLLSQGDYRGAAARAEEAIRTAPRLAAAYRVAEVAEARLSHMEASLAIPREAMRQLDGPESAYFDPPLNENLGAYRRAALEHGADTLSSEGRARFLLSLVLQAEDFARAHEVGRARAALARLDPGQSQNAAYSLTDIEAENRAALDDWTGLLALSQAYALKRSLLPVAYAMAGRIETARALAAATPLDCDECVIARGRVAAAAHDWAAADRWFQMLMRRSPSSPLPPAAWGKVLLAKGDLDDAISKLQIAHSRSPDFADPLDFWGEALMKKGDLDAAISEFAQADRNAPRWGRNHLLWGEALMLRGRYAEARAQYVAASGMDLSKPDRAALDLLLVRTSKGPLHG